MVYMEKGSVDVVFDDIADIMSGKENLHIKVRVVRLWKVPSFLNPSEFTSVEMVLVDEKVIMDVVFNHTAEGNEKRPIISFRGVDNSMYYLVAPKGEFYNYSGCGNTFNCNHPVVRKFIVDCLSLWNGVNVFGAPIEGDLLAIGTPLSSPPLIDMS